MLRYMFTVVSLILTWLSEPLTGLVYRTSSLPELGLWQKRWLPSMSRYEELESIRKAFTPEDDPHWQGESNRGVPGMMRYG